MTTTLSQTIENCTKNHFKGVLTFEFLKLLQNDINSFASTNNNTGVIGSNITINTSLRENQLFCFQFSYDYDKEQDKKGEGDANLRDDLLREFKYLITNTSKKNPSGDGIWILSPVASTFLIISNFKFDKFKDVLTTTSLPINYSLTQVRKSHVVSVRDFLTISVPFFQSYIKHDKNLWVNTLALFLTI